MKFQCCGETQAELAEGWVWWEWAGAAPTRVVLLQLGQGRCPQLSAALPTHLVPPGAVQCQLSSGKLQWDREMLSAPGLAGLCDWQCLGRGKFGMGRPERSSALLGAG